MELLVLVALVSAVYSYSAFRLGIGSLSEPGAGFYPLVLAVCALLSSVFLIWQWRGKKERFALLGLNAEERKNWVKVLAYVVPLALYPLGLRYAGYPIATAALLLYLLWMSGVRHVLQGLVLVGGFTAAMYLLFAKWLGVPLP